MEEGPKVLSVEEVEEARGIAEETLNYDFDITWNYESEALLARVFLELHAFWVSEGGPPLHLT